MSRVFSITGDFEEIGEEIEEKFIESASGGGKGVSRGHKTIEAIKKQNKEDAERQRKEDAISDLKKELEHFPTEFASEEQASEVINEYANWVVKSLEQNYPYFNDLDKDIVYSQSKSSGPGGQNVNKTSTAVTAKHILTGMQARSEDSREMLVNKKESMAKILERLERHIGNWRVFLKGKDVSKKEEIESFIKELGKEKSE